MKRNEVHRPSSQVVEAGVEEWQYFRVSVYGQVVAALQFILLSNLNPFLRLR